MGFGVVDRQSRTVVFAGSVIVKSFAGLEGEEFETETKTRSLLCLTNFIIRNTLVWTWCKCCGDWTCYGACPSWLALTATLQGWHKITWEPISPCFKLCFGAWPMRNLWKFSYFTKLQTWFNIWCAWKLASVISEMYFFIDGSLRMPGTKGCVRFQVTNTPAVFHQDDVVVLCSWLHQHATTLTRQSVARGPVQPAAQCSLQQSMGFGPRHLLLHCSAHCNLVTSKDTERVQLININNKHVYKPTRSTFSLQTRQTESIQPLDF